MKRCPKCSRTFPDDNQKFCTIDGGLLVSADQPFDPNATVFGSANLEIPVEPPPEKPVSSREPDFGATIATQSSAPTVVFPKKTGPTGSATASNLQQPPPKASQQAKTLPPTTVPPPPPASAPLPPTQTAALPPTPNAPTQTAALPPTKSAPVPPRTAALPPTPSAPLPPKQSAPLPQAAPASSVPPKKKSKLPLILGILAILLVLGIGGVVAAFFLVVKPRLEQMNANRGVVVIGNENANTNTNSNTNATETPTEPVKTETEFVAPPDTTKFTNSIATLDPKLAEHYVDFSFYYPNGWVPDPKAGIAGSGNFAKVERRLPPDFTQENFAVRWYESQGTYAADFPTYPKRVEAFSAELADAFPDYRKVSEGPTKINSLEAYEFRWEGVSKGTVKGDLKLWGRVVFVPTGVAGNKDGAILSMFTTSLAPELSSVGDVGEKGQTPVILESFRFGKTP